MAALLFDILFVAVGAAIGGAAGWWVRGNGVEKQAAPSPEPLASDPPERREEARTETPDFDPVERMMARLQQLTESVAADVGQHNSRVQEINAELTADGNKEANVIAIVEKLVQANEAMQSQLRSAEERLQEQAREIEVHVKDARTDALTKLFNRRSFDDEIRRCADQYRKDARPSCVMMIDVDHFKKFNDTYGHQAGDAVLRGVADTLRKNLPGKDIVCRYGGEEFAVIFPGSDVASARPAAERARAAVAAEVFEFEGRELKVTASAGLAQLQPNETAEEAVKRADEALYASKEAGRNCGHWHDGQECHPLADAAKEESIGEAEGEVQAAPQTVNPADDEGPAMDRRDRISGLSDRESFFRDVDRRLSEWKRGGSPLSVLLVEVDGFQRIVGEYGDKAGEIVLRAAAQFLKATMRDMDHVARYDEHVFGLLLPGAGAPEASSVAERLRTAIERCKLPVSGEELTFSVSLGAAVVVDGDEREDLLDRAETSLMAAKRSGGNCSFATSENGQCRAMALWS